MTEASIADDWRDKLVIERPIDWANSMVRGADLRAWLKRKGITGTIFDDHAGTATEDFSDTKHAHHAPELALAVRAWRAVSAGWDGGGTVKSALKNWIAGNRNEWTGHKDPGKDTLGRISMVANWHPGGGRPKKQKPPGD